MRMDLLRLGKMQYDLFSVMYFFGKRGNFLVASDNSLVKKVKFDSPVCVCVHAFFPFFWQFSTKEYDLEL